MMLIAQFAQRIDNASPVARRCLHAATACVAVAVGLIAVGAARAQPAEGEDASPIDQWVQQLDADRFVQREDATQRLIAAGNDAVDPVARAVVGGSLEVITRGTFILRQIAVSDDAAAAAAAQDALQRLASSQTTAVARRAKSTLRAVGGLLQDRSMRQLEHLGAQVFRADQRVLLRIAPNLFTVRIGRQWRGGREGLTHLSRLIDVQQVVLEGPQVDDRWLQQLKPLRDLRAVTIIGGNITDDGLAHLSHVQNLQYLRLWYVPLTDASIDHLKRHRKLEELELYGTDIAREAVDRLLDHVEEGAIDYRRGGGFLGVGCTLHGDGGCRITSVEPGTAAANAGLRAGDHIVRLGECKQPTFEQLTAEIGYHRPGEKIEVELVRTAGQPSVVKGVTLGAWTIDYRLQ